MTINELEIAIAELKKKPYYGEQNYELIALERMLDYRKAVQS